MVLCATEALGALARRRAALVDVLRNRRGTNEAHGLDRLGIEDGIDGLLAAVHNVENTSGAAGLNEELRQANRHGGVALGGLEHEGIARRQGRAGLPQWNHGRKIERGDSRYHAERLAQRIRIDAGANLRGVLALELVRRTKGKLQHVDAAQHVSLGIRESLAVFEGELGGQLIHVGMDEADPLHDDADALLRVQRRPTRLGLSGFRNDAVHVGLVRQGHRGLLLAGRRIQHGLGIARRPFKRFSVDVVIHSAHGASPSWNLRLPVWLGSHTNVE